jgi:chemotaxis protein CheD
MELKSHFLYPSTLFVSKDPYIVNTILGSCVAVCLYDPTTQIGGINHYMLPFWNGEGLASPKYGNIAIEKLNENMLSLGCKKGNIVAKVFGGGEVIETQISQFHIGERNIQVAQQMLKELRINITGQSLGGNNGRKIQFNTQTGAVLQKIIPKQNFDKK